VLMLLSDFRKRPDDIGLRLRPSGEMVPVSR
jgi:hypothetical protein